MVIGAYRDLFAAIAASAGTLTGLLFVAVSVVPRRGGVTGLDVIQQVRAAAALLAFTDALAISLYGLVPGTNVGYPAAVMGIIGILFTAAGTRSILSSRSTRRQQSQQLELFIVLLVIFGAELVSGIAVIADSHRSTPVNVISYAMVSSLFVGIARAWELVGDRDTGIRASIAVLAGRNPGAERTPAPEPADAPEPATAGLASAPAHESDAHHAGERTGSAPAAAAQGKGKRSRTAQGPRHGERLSPDPCDLRFWGGWRISSRSGPSAAISASTPYSAGRSSSPVSTVGGPCRCGAGAGNADSTVALRSGGLARRPSGRIRRRRGATRSWLTTPATLARYLAGWLPTWLPPIKASTLLKAALVRHGTSCEPPGGLAPIARWRRNRPSMARTCQVRR